MAAERRTLPPPFDTLSPDEVTRVEAGATLAREQDAVREAIALLEGDVEIRRDDRLLTIARAPATLRLAFALGAGRAMTIRALGACSFVRLPAPTLERLVGEDAMALRIRAHLADEIAQAEDAREALVTGHDDVFEGIGAVLPLGPYTFDRIQATLFVVQGDAERVRALLPPGLLPLPSTAGRYLLLASQIGDARFPEAVSRRSFAYRECIPLVPCLTGTGAAGTFAPEVYPDSYHATLLGREIYGFPKRLSRLFASEGALDVVTGHQVTVSARWRGREAVTAGEFSQGIVEAISSLSAPPWLARALGAVMDWQQRAPEDRLPEARMFVRKRIARAEEPERLALDQLVEVPFRLRHVGEWGRLVRPELRFAPSHPLLHGHAIAAFSFHLGFSFHRGRVRRTYT